MAVADRQGRLFGRVNVVDAIVLLIALALVLLAVGAYSMFRAPLPRLSGIEPGVLTSGPNLRVMVKGENLRPYMRVSFGDHQGVNFLFQSTDIAHVDLGDLPPGEYDVVLYDHVQERGRLPKALTVKPSPLPDSQVIAVGSFANLDAAQAARIVAGMTIPGVGEVLERGDDNLASVRVQSGSTVVEVPGQENQRLPALIRMGCFLRVSAGTPECAVGGVGLHPTAVLRFKTELGDLLFQVDEVRGTQPLQQIRAVVRFSGPRELVSQIRPGDVDLGQWRNELAAGARVHRVVERVATQDTMTRDAELDVDIQRASHGWVYGAAPLRAGTVLTFRTEQYQLQGTVLSLEPAADSTTPIQ